MALACSPHVQRVIETLSHDLSGKVFTPGTESYQESENSYWRLQERSYSPCCIVTPSSREDVVTVIQTLNGDHGDDVTHGCNFAIRGGGHTTWSGASNVDGGITIDMSHLNDVELSDDKNVVSISAGARWKQVYAKLDPLGFTVAGGRDADVGVAGLTLGGGLSYFSARKGFACDNVIDFEVVLADGQVTNANANENSDLWAALKGGSNNFGVVTKFEFAAIPTDGIWGGRIFFDDSVQEQLLDFFVGLNQKDGYDEYASLILSCASVYGMGYFWIADTHYTKPEAYPTTFEPLTSIQPQLSNTLRFANQSSFVEEFASDKGPGQRWIFMTNTFANDRALLTKVYETFKKVSLEAPQSPGTSFSFSLQPINVPMLKASKESGQNMLGLSVSEGPLVLCLVAAVWQDKAQDDDFYSLTRKLLDQIATLAKDDGLLNDWVYANYASNTQDPLGGYGVENRKFMEQVSQEYDPHGLFQKHVLGGFKLFKD